MISKTKLVKLNMLTLLFIATFYFGTLMQLEQALAETDKTQSKRELTCCPVTKNWFVTNKHTRTVNYKGVTYYFCCKDCKEKFLKNPEKYIPELSNGAKD